MLIRRRQVQNKAPFTGRFFLGNLTKRTALKVGKRRSRERADHTTFGNFVRQIRINNVRVLSGRFHVAERRLQNHSRRVKTRRKPMFDAIKDVVYHALIRVTNQFPLELRELKRGHATNRGKRSVVGVSEWPCKN